MTWSREARHDRLDEVMRLLERHRVLESLAERQQTSRRDLLGQMQRRENLVELRRYLRGTHPADLAEILAALSLDERRIVFGQLSSRDGGLTLLEVEPGVRASILESLSDRDLSAAVAELDADDLALLSSALPPAIVRQASDALAARGQSSRLPASAYPEGTVGRLMRQEVLNVRADLTVGGAIECLRAAAMPPQTDRVFVVDARHVLQGSVALPELIRADPSTALAQMASRDIEAFTAEEPAKRAAKAFERYDLVSAPVVDRVGKLIGRITIDGIVDYLRAESEQTALAQAGLRGAEDLFAPVSQSARNRWPWLAVNLFTAFAASRVIAAFEDTITQVVALAALMPIVASIGGNTGNQTVALVIRALALDQLRDTQGRLARKELAIGAVNGLTWGVVVGVLALLLYRGVALASVMAAAVFLNLVIAALAGVAVPLGLRWSGRDPAHGASVVLTFVTDGMGFFLFLGLARLFLV